jgi:hypothetical protein
MQINLPLNQLARRRTAAVVVIAGLLVLGPSILSGASAAPKRSKHSTTRLTLTRRNPVTVSGHGFRPRARVHVRLVTTRTLSRTPTANQAGAFTVTFPVVIDRCSGWSISAAQRQRPTAVLRGSPKPQCAPASAP